MGSLALLTKISGDKQLSLEVMRGMPDNVTTEMDIALWKTAVRIRADLKSANMFYSSEAPALTQAYLKGDLPPEAQAAVVDFLAKYGMRGVGEIDFGRSRWRDDPPQSCKH